MFRTYGFVMRNDLFQKVLGDGDDVRLFCVFYAPERGDVLLGDIAAGADDIGVLLEEASSELVHGVNAR